jgi:small subunit ribosomal protein S6e
MVFKICINEPKTKKSWQIEKEAPALIGLKIGENFEGSFIGLSGFILQITGGSDKDGFPMRYDLIGSSRKKALLSGMPGFRPKVKGLRKRKYIRGNTISLDIVQVNCKVVEGEGDIPTMLGIQPKEKKPEEKAEAPKEEKKE